MATCQNNRRPVPNPQRQNNCGQPQSQRHCGRAQQQNTHRQMFSPGNHMPPSSQEHCGCRQDGCGHSLNDPLRGMPPAMAYVPWQQWQNIYEPCRGFERGTVFEELDKPFVGRGGRCQ